jgi:hypothetical protein
MKIAPGDWCLDFCLKSLYPKSLKKLSVKFILRASFKFKVLFSKNFIFYPVEILDTGFLGAALLD